MDDLEEWFVWNDSLFDITNIDKAERWLNTIWTTMTPFEMDKVIKLFFQWPSIIVEKQTMKKQKGKGARQSRKEDRMQKHSDLRITRLLAVADSIHDFARDPEELMEGQEIIPDWAIPPWFVCPAELTTEKILNSKLYIEIMTTKKRLSFPNGKMMNKVTNPLYKANFMKMADQYDMQQMVANGISKKVSNMYDFVYAKYFRQSQSLLRASKPKNYLPLEIWHRNNMNDIQRFQQIIQVIGALRKLYGTSITAVIDSTNQMYSAMLVSLHYITQAFVRKITDNTTIQTVETVTRNIRELIEQEQMEEHSWNLVAMDATLFDPSNDAISIPLYTNPTGEVYPLDMGNYRVKLNGIHEIQIAAKTKKIVVSVEIQDTNGKVYQVHPTRNETTKNISRKTIEYLIESRVRRQEDREPISAWKEGDFASTCGQCSNEMLLALKRAGDWGQVEACAKHGWVLFTMDKHMALYAQYRGVRYVYIKSKNFKDSTSVPIQMQHTFVMAHHSGC